MDLFMLGFGGVWVDSAFLQDWGLLDVILNTEN
jgi:hypothetical protein